MVKKVKLRSISRPEIRHLDKFGIPSDEDYEILKEFLPSEVPKEDIFVYSVRLCDNLVDREGEFFSLGALQKVTEMVVGKAGIFDHIWSGGKIHSRIYKAELFTDDEHKNETLEPYRYIVGYAYTLNTEKNKDLIDAIKAGILKEVSLGFNSDEYSSITLDDGRSVSRIDNITDVYEWSFVAVPAQPFAGVIKSFNKEVVESMDLKEALVKLKSFQGLDQQLVNHIATSIETMEKNIAELDKLKAKVKSLEAEVEEKENRVKELEEELFNTTLEHTIEDVLSDFELVSETAGEIARQLVADGISIDEQGNIQGVEETKAKLKSDYSFLFKNVKQVDTEDEDEDTDFVYDDSEGYGVVNKTKSFKRVNRKAGIDFTNVSTYKNSATTKSARKPLGLHFE